jgi:hypothetical protein
MPHDDKKFTGKQGSDMGNKGFSKDKDTTGKNVWDKSKVSSGDIKGKSGDFGKSSNIHGGKTGTSQTGTQGGFNKPQTPVKGTEGKLDKGTEGKGKKRAA